mmetsp:Transcript_30611/g.65776  ORF Transcript_30611/g.65776 Transcript_30611/m.65776 type:complete len:208 (+) Transcript_30611:138-761(+)
MDMQYCTSLNWMLSSIACSGVVGMIKLWVGLIWPAIRLCGKGSFWLCANLIWPGICQCAKGIWSIVFQSAKGVWLCANDSACIESSKEAVAKVAAALVMLYLFVRMIQWLSWMIRCLFWLYENWTSNSIHTFVAKGGETRMINPCCHIPGNRRNHDHLKHRHVSRASAEAEVYRMRQNSHIYEGTERLNAYYNERLQAWFVGRSGWS